VPQPAQQDAAHRDHILKLLGKTEGNAAMTYREHVNPETDQGRLPKPAGSDPTLSMRGVSAVKVTRRTRDRELSDARIAIRLVKQQGLHQPKLPED